MSAKLRHIFALLTAAAMFFASCSSDGGSSGGSGGGDTPDAKKAVLSFDSSVVVSETANALTVSDIVPCSEKSFSVYLKDGKPTSLTVTSSSANVSVKASEFSAAAEEGASYDYVATVTYAVNAFEEVTSDLTVTAAVEGSASVSKTVSLTASVIEAVETYKVTDLAQTLDAENNPTSDHEVEATWTLPQEATVKNIYYYLLQTSDAEGEVALEKAYKSDLTAIDASATTLTGTGLPSSSSYTLYIYTVTQDGWSLTELAELKTASDTTPPVTPSVTAGTSGYESVALVYTKGSDDDTYSLKITIPSGATLVTSESVVCAEGADDTVLVSDLASGQSLTIPFTVARSASETSYNFTVIAYDQAGNAHTDAEGAEAVAVEAKVLADTQAPEDIASLTLDLVEPKLAWTYGEFTDTDFAEVKVYVDSAAEASYAVNKGSEASIALNHLPASSVKITTIDTLGNESEGVTVNVPAAVSLTNVETGLTGQLKASVTGLASGYTLTAEGAQEGQTAVYDAETSKVYVNGLTVGTDVAPSAIITASASNHTIRFKVSAEEKVAPVKIVWSIRNWYPTQNPPYIVPHLSSEITSSNLVAAVNNSVDGNYNKSDMSYTDATYTDWIVWPALSGEVNAVSFEATGKKAESSGYYIYADLPKSKSWQASYSNKTGWDYNYSSNPQLWVVAKDSMSEEDLSKTGFIVANSTTGYAGEIPSGYNGWFTVQSSKDKSYYWLSSCFNLSVSTTKASNGDSDICYKEVIWTGSEASDPPTFTESMVTYESDEKSITLSWTEPSDKDFSHIKVSTTEKDYNDNAIESVTVNAGITSLTISNLKAATSYPLTLTAYDAFGNPTAVTVTVATAQDATPPSNPTAIVVDMNAKTISWTEPSDIDYAGVKVYADGSETASYTVNKADGTSVSFTSINSSVKVTAFDGAGNESEGVRVSIPESPVVSRVAIGVTGQLLIDVDSIISSYTWKAEGAVEGQTAVFDAESMVIFVNGLTVGQEVTPSAVMFTESNGNVVKYLVTASESKTPVKIVWNIRNFWPIDNPPYIVPHLASGVTASNLVAAVNNSVSGTSQTSDMSYTNATYQNWIIWPALSGDAGAVSFEATDKKAQSSGLYIYADFQKSKSWQNSYSNKSGWGYEKSGNPQLWVADKDSMSQTQLSQTGFIVADSTTGYNGDVVQGYEGWFTVQSSKDNAYYWISSSFNLSVSTTKASNGDSDICYKESVWTGSEESDAPGSVTNFASGTVTKNSITLSWTDPSDSDFDYVEITYSTGSNTNTVNVEAGMQEVTLTKLLPGATYTIKAKAYDAFGDSSEESTVEVATEAAEGEPLNVTATARFTGEILVTWDRSVTDTDSNWQYKVECSDEAVAAQSFTSLTPYKGTYADASAGVAQFKGLASGSEYTFTVYASPDGSEWKSAASVTATAETVKKRIRSTLADKNHSDKNNIDLNTSSGANILCCQWSTGGGTAEWNIYPALDGSIAVSHSVTTSSGTMEEVYDTFSIYHTSKGFAILNVSGMTSSTETALLNNVSFSASTTEDLTGASTFFFGYNSTASSYTSSYTLRSNASDKNYALGYKGVNSNNDEILYFDDATDAMNLV